MTDKRRILIGDASLSPSDIDELMSAPAESWPRRCSLAVYDGQQERVIVADRYYSPELSAVHNTLTDFGVPHRIGYSDRFISTIMFDTIQENTG